MTEPTESQLEAELRIQHLAKKRVAATIYGVLCLVGGIAIPKALWPETFGDARLMFHEQIELLGSTTLGWVFVIGSGVVLLGMAFRYGARVVSTTREIGGLRRVAT